MWLYESVITDFDAFIYISSKLYQKSTSESNWGRALLNVTKGTNPRKATGKVGYSESTNLAQGKSADFPLQHI